MISQLFELSDFVTPKKGWWRFWTVDKEEELVLPLVDNKVVRANLSSMFIELDLFLWAPWWFSTVRNWFAVCIDWSASMLYPLKCCFFRLENDLEPGSILSLDPGDNLESLRAISGGTKSFFCFVFESLLLRWFLWRAFRSLSKGIVRVILRNELGPPFDEECLPECSFFFKVLVVSSPGSSWDESILDAFPKNSRTVVTLFE